MSKNILWLDTETTGLDESVHGLREVAVLLEVDGVVVSKFNWFIDTMSYYRTKWISDYVEINMGITKETLKEYPSSSAQFENFENFLKENKLEDEKYTLAGYNIDFDKRFLKDWFRDNDYIQGFDNYFSHSTLDVLPFVRMLNYAGVIDTKNNQLKTLCDYFEIPLDAHNAIDDIIATKQLNEILIEKLVIEK